MTRESRKSKKQRARERKLEIKEQNSAFNAKVYKLLDRKYRYSIRYENSLIEDDGKAYINVDLTKVDTPFSVYSYDTRVDPEIYAYIDSAAFFLRTAIPVVINFDDGGRYTEEMKDKIKRAVIRHYALEFEDKLYEHRRRLLFGWLTFAIGIILLSLYIILYTFIKEQWTIFLEIITIFTWVFIWQSADNFFFSGHERRVDLYNSAQLAVAEVKFGEPEHIKK